MSLLRTLSTRRFTTSLQPTIIYHRPNFMRSGSLKTSLSVLNSTLLMAYIRPLWNTLSRLRNTIKKILIKPKEDRFILNRSKKEKNKPNFKKLAFLMFFSPLKLFMFWEFGILSIKPTKLLIMPSFMKNSKRPKFHFLRMIRSSNFSNLKKKMSFSKTTKSGFQNYLRFKKSPKMQIKKKTLNKKAKNPLSRNAKSQNQMSKKFKFLSFPKIRTK